MQVADLRFAKIDRMWIRRLAGLLTMLACAVHGCAEPSPALPTSRIDVALSDSERESLDPALRKVYDAAVAGTLIGASAADYQEAFAKAHETRGDPAGDASYGFELVPTDQCGEGPPHMGVSVVDGHIARCIIGCPEF